MSDNIFFDIDGTLHKEDIFSEFITYSLIKDKLRLCLFFPLFLLALFIYLANKEGKIGINIILYFLFFNKKDRDSFIETFCNEIKINKNHKVIDRLNFHLQNKHRIFLISGTPEILIKKLYQDILAYDNVVLIGSEIIFGYNSVLLKERCISKNKLRILDKRMGKPIYFDEGYSDSELDVPVLKRCKKKFFVSKDGDLVDVNLDE